MSTQRPWALGSYSTKHRVGTDGTGGALRCGGNTTLWRQPVILASERIRTGRRPAGREPAPQHKQSFDSQSGVIAHSPGPPIPTRSDRKNCFIVRIKKEKETRLQQKQICFLRVYSVVGSRVGHAHRPTVTPSIDSAPNRDNKLQLLLRSLRHRLNLSPLLRRRHVTVNHVEWNTDRVVSTHAKLTTNINTINKGI